MRCINTILCVAVLCVVGGGVRAQEPATTDLLAHFPVAVVSQDASTLGEIPVDANEFFAGGWYQAGAPAASGRIYRWMGPRAGAMDFSLVAQRELSLEIGLAVPRAAGVPAFTVRFYWNGGFIGGALLDKQAQIAKMTVPAGLTRAGRNRLEIIPSFWVNANKLAGETSDSNVSVNLYHLKFLRDTNASAPNVTPKRAIDNSIEQPSNTVISLYETVPSNARLTIAGKWDGAAPSAEALVVLTTQSGETKQLARFTSGALENRIEVELPDSDSELAFGELSLVVRESDEPSTIRTKFVWTQLTLTSLAAEEHIAKTPPVPPTKPNVILYVIDTLRASHLEPYGATNVKTPNFTALAQQGLMFSTAISHTSWTRPSVVTILTSQYETTHGTTTMEHMLSKAVPYLPEILRSAGYHTAAVSMNGHVAPQWGFGRGFDSFATLNTERNELITPPEPRAYVDKLWDKYVAPGIKRDNGPFFLYLHELDPHGPYTPPAPFDTMYPTHYRGQPEVEADHIALVRSRLTELDAEDFAYLESRYRGEVSFVDAILGSLMARLKQEGLADNTVLIVVSDHGEEFGEHGGIGHSVTLYEEMLRVPMFWVWPGHVEASRRVDAPIGLVDFAPTLLSLLGIPAPKEMRGRDMTGFVLGAETSAAPLPMFSYKSDQPGRALQAVHYGPWKLIERMWGPMSNFQLFNLADDPREITNRWIGERVVGGALRQTMAWERHTAGPAAPTEQNKLETLDPETIEQLRNLGYVQ